MSTPPPKHPLIEVYGTESHPLAGRYVVEREVGKGASATVFVARDIRHDRHVALKVLRTELTSSGSTRFLREIDIASKLTHPHILPIHDSGEADGYLYYVMPFIEDETLATRIARGDKISVDEALHIARDVGNALQYAHDHGVIHRDIKPENILLPGGVAVVTDFGLARALIPSHGNTRITEVGIGLGTPLYMSPEQVVADVDLDARADQYSFACVLYEILAGRPLFAGYNYQKVLSAHVTEAPTPLRKVRPEIPPPVDAAIMRALSKSPSDRFASVQEFVEVLRGPTVSRSGVRHRFQAASRRQRVVMGVGAVAVLALGAWFGRNLRVTAVPGRTAIDANLVVIAPFDVLSDSLALWREGLMDMLVQHLDGAGPLRAVSPTVSSRAAGRGDRAGALALARSTRAGLACYGSLVPMGADSVRATVRILDTQRDTVIGDIEFRGATLRMDLLSDSLGMRVLRKLNESRPITATLRGSLRSKSLPALRAFLRGEQLYRRNDFAAARSQYQEAATLDTTFALAYRRLRTVYRTFNDADSLIYGKRAAALNRGLAPRDSLLILADSLDQWQPGNLVFIAVDDLNRVKRSVGILEQLSRTYPDDPEVWNELGEVRFHTFRAAASADSTLFAFQKALEADSLFGPAYPHAIDLTLFLHGPEPALVLADRYLKINPKDERIAAVVELLRANGTDDIDAAIKKYSRPAMEYATYSLSRAAMENDVGIRVLQRMVALQGVPRDRVWLAAALRFRGRVTEAIAVDDAPLRDSRGLIDLVFSAWYAQSPPTALSGRVDSMARAIVASESRDFMVLAIAWAGRRRDVATLLAIETIARKRESASAADADRNGWRYLASAAGAYRALASGDSLGAARMFRLLPDTLGPVLTPAPIVLDAARVLASTGSAAAASSMLDRHPPLAATLLGWTVLWHMERANVAQRNQESARAATSLAYVRMLVGRADSTFAAAASPKGSRGR